MISTKQLSFIFQSAVKAGSEKCFRDGGLLDQYISLSRAYALYGRTNVDRWISEKLISTIDCVDGVSAKKTICRKSIEAVALTSNRISYLPVAER
ncbi:hypothetical protein ASE74_20840 [Pedobacter sp. Leaf216]|uniref:hypothetical protein n=1 Tax=Pedobacter sp. Leaf216 TaxID=1735684 RepID=UPI0006F8005D|nr:hypothetical protein [Pedobacter sp. Leaf216]KQM75268.1 hypothetical protein ASE74_20840 [Pedobacter sp. Leaf216]